jgi:hypothetical protein
MEKVVDNHKKSNWVKGRGKNLYSPSPQPSPVKGEGIYLIGV